MPNLIGPLLPLIGILVLLAVVVGVINILTAGQRTPKGFPYEKEDSLFSPAERTFLGVLEQAVGDKSHAQAKRQTRDDFVNQALAAAGVPLFRFPAKRAYSVQGIQSQIFQQKG